MLLTSILFALVCFSTLTGAQEEDFTCKHNAPYWECVVTTECQFVVFHNTTTCAQSNMTCPAAATCYTHSNYRRTIGWLAAVGVINGVGVALGIFLTLMYPKQKYVPAKEVDRELLQRFYLVLALFLLSFFFWPADLWSVRRSLRMRPIAVVEEEEELAHLKNDANQEEHVSLLYPFVCFLEVVGIIGGAIVSVTLGIISLSDPTQFEATAISTLLTIYLTLLLIGIPRIYMYNVMTGAGLLVRAEEREKTGEVDVSLKFVNLQNVDKLASIPQI